MGETTGIAWCHHTFNPWWGCEKVSPACDRCYAENTASRRCLEKNGYKLIGTARRRMWRNGAWHDLLLFDILEEDWFAEHPPGAR